MGDLLVLNMSEVVVQQPSTASVSRLYSRVSSVCCLVSQDFLGQVLQTTSLSHCWWCRAQIQLPPYHLFPWTRFVFHHGIFVYWQSPLPVCLPRVEIFCPMINNARHFLLTFFLTNPSISIFFCSYPGCSVSLWDPSLSYQLQASV